MNYNICLNEQQLNALQSVMLAFCQNDFSLVSEEEREAFMSINAIDVDYDYNPQR